jgi:hypothetical protein
MRRFDKLKNIHKANLLNEVRYLESKGLITEDTNISYEQEIDDIINKLNNNNQLEPILIQNKYSIKKEGDGFEITMGDKKWLIDNEKRLKRFLLGKFFEDNKGKNINLSKYKTEKIKGNDLKIGDVYVRNIDGARYVYKVLSGFRKYSGNPNFYLLDVEVLDVGAQVKVVSPYPNGDYEILGQNIGDKVTDRFKNMYGSSVSNYTNNIKFGDVIKILDYQKI